MIFNLPKNIISAERELYPKDGFAAWAATPFEVKTTLLSLISQKIWFSFPSLYKGSSLSTASW